MIRATFNIRLVSLVSNSSAFTLVPLPVQYQQRQQLRRWCDSGLTQEIAAVKKEVPFGQVAKELREELKGNSAMIGKVFELDFRQRFPRQFGENHNIGTMGELFSALPISHDEDLSVVSQKNRLANYVYKNCTTNLLKKLTGKEFGKINSEYFRAYDEIKAFKHKLKNENKTDDNNDDDDHHHHETKLDIFSDLKKLYEAAGAHTKNETELDHNLAIKYLVEKNHKLIVPLILASDRFIEVKEAKNLCTTLEIDGLSYFNPNQANMKPGLGISEIKSSVNNKDDQRNARAQLYLRVAFFDEVLHRILSETDHFNYPAYLFAMFYYLKKNKLETSLVDVTEEVGEKMGKIHRFSSVLYQELG